LFSLAWSSSLQTIFIGCQNTSLQFFDFEQLHQDTNGSEVNRPNINGPAPLRIAHRFFDSYPQYERKPADLFAVNPGSSYSSMGSDDGMRSEAMTPPRAYLHIPPNNVIDSAHYGYIYCMALLPSSRDGSDDDLSSEKSTQLVTGSGDETIKVVVIASSL
jgi:di- and tripeptidase